MNRDQQITLEIMVLIAVVIVFTANKSSKFWKALFTPTSLQIEGPQLPPLFTQGLAVNVNVPNPFQKAGT